MESIQQIVVKAVEGIFKTMQKTGLENVGRAVKALAPVLWEDI